MTMKLTPWILALSLVSISFFPPTASASSSSSRLERQDGTVISPVPAGMKLEEGDKLVVSEGSLTVKVGGTDMVISAGSNLAVNKGQGGQNFEIFLEKGRAETRAPAPSANEAVYLVTKDGGRLRVDEKNDQVSIAEVGSGKPANLQVVESVREPSSASGPSVPMAPPPPPPPPPMLPTGPAQFEAAPGRKPDNVVTNVPQIDIPPITCVTCPASVRLNVQVE